MKLILFLDKESFDKEEDTLKLSKLSKGNLYSLLPKEQQDLITEEQESFLNGIFIETAIKGNIISPISFNYYNIIHTPTIIFLNESEVIYRWEKIPELSEIAKSVVNYFKILRSFDMDYNYDPEE